MTRTEELLKLAEAATSGPWNNPRGIVHEAQLPFTPVVATTLIAKVYSTNYGDFRESEANAAFIAAANPETIKQLVELVQSMKFHFDTIADEENWGTDGAWESSSYPDEIAMEAIEAFNKWENGK
jgi:hypothetical protein